MATAPHDPDESLIGAVPAAQSSWSDRDVVCPECGYCLRGLRETVCPECGVAFDPQELTTTRRRHWNPPPGTGWMASGASVFISGLLASFAAGYAVDEFRTVWFHPTCVTGRIDPYGFDILIGVSVFAIPLAAAEVAASANDGPWPARIARIAIGSCLGFWIVCVIASSAR